MVHGQCLVISMQYWIKRIKLEAGILGSLVLVNSGILWRLVL